MKKENDYLYFLNISPNKFGIYLFDKSNLKNLYEEEINFNYSSNFINFNILKEFLDNNIFEIEKLSGKFLENIFLIFENKNIFNLEMGIKKKNYNVLISNENLKNSLVEAKDLFRENYQDQEIIHMIIKKYFIDGKSYLSLKENFKCDSFALEINFISISNDNIYDLNKILEKYQIKISKFIDGNYIKSFFHDHNDMNLADMTYKILNGQNQNEVVFATKNNKKLDFFEKFFQLFS